jgi:MtN3 and saliva related transmembrane protein
MARKDREAYRSAQKAANGFDSRDIRLDSEPAAEGLPSARRRHAGPSLCRMLPAWRRLSSGLLPTGIDMEWMGYLAAVLTTVAFVPQALKTIRSRDTGGISLAMYVVFTIGVACWFGYGVALGSWPMILANVITFVLAATILGLKLKHG